MTYILALLAGLAGAVVGFFLAGGLGASMAGALGMSNFEGAIGYFAFLVCGPFGAVAGLFVGMWLVFRRQHQGFLPIAGRMGMIVVGIAMLVGGGIAIRLLTIDHFDGLNPQVEFEIRLPAGATTPAAKSAIEIEVQTKKQRNSALLQDDWLKRDGERAVLSGFVPLYVRTAERMLVVSVPDAPKLIFKMPQAATPKVSETFGPWVRVDFVDQPGATQPRRPSPEEHFDIRYRVPEWTKPTVQSSAEADEPVE
jgi:hypothetical protein